MYYIYTIRWSQTDDDKVIVRADDWDKADALVEQRFHGARYRERNGSTKLLIVA